MSKGLVGLVRGHVFVVATGRLEWLDYEQFTQEGSQVLALVAGEWIPCRKPTEADKVTHEQLTWVGGPVFLAD